MRSQRRWRKSGYCIDLQDLAGVAVEVGGRVTRFKPGEAFASSACGDEYLVALDVCTLLKRKVVVQMR